MTSSLTDAFILPASTPFTAKNSFALLIDDQDRTALMMDYGATFMKPSYQTPALAKKMGGKKGFALKDYEINQWSRISLDVQRDISRFKFDNYQQVRQDLLLKVRSLSTPHCAAPRNVSGKASSLTAPLSALITSVLSGCSCVILIYKSFNTYYKFFKYQVIYYKFFKYQVIYTTILSFLNTR